MESKLLKGDNIELLKELEENSVDSIVTDPPYGLSFMNKKWDYDVPSTEFWKEVYRVLKPGGHVLSFGGTRTYHRMVVNMEDAGFEIRDQIQWLYGSGFPKSHNIGKSYDKKMGNDTKGNSEYEGWGTALKPANEPICLARKPLSEKTIVDNVIEWETGGMNIDGCRVGSDILQTKGRFPANVILDEEAGQILDKQSGIGKSTGGKGKATQKSLDRTDIGYGYKEIDNASGLGGYGDIGGASRFFYSAKVSKKERNMGLDGLEDKESVMPGLNTFDENGNRLRADGSIIPPLVSKNNHPTIKPVSLMTYLCRLITPKGGVVLDPFMGSGSTGISALLEGFNFIGMEMDEDYFKIAEERINNYEEYREFIKK